MRATPQQQKRMTALRKKIPTERWQRFFERRKVSIKKLAERLGVNPVALHSMYHNTYRNPNSPSERAPAEQRRRAIPLTPEGPIQSPEEKLLDAVLPLKDKMPPSLRRVVELTQEVLRDLKQIEEPLPRDIHDLKFSTRKKPIREEIAWQARVEHLRAVLKSNVNELRRWYDSWTEEQQRKQRKSE
jgi:hypothetical protein